MPMYDEGYTPPPSEKEKAHAELQKHYRNFLARENLTEDLENLETQHATKVQDFYSKTDWDSPEQRQAVQDELVEEQKNLATTRAIIEQLVRASEGKAYGRKDK